MDIVVTSSSALSKYIYSNGRPSTSQGATSSTSASSSSSPRPSFSAASTFAPPSASKSKPKGAASSSSALGPGRGSSRKPTPAPLALNFDQFTLQMMDSTLTLIDELEENGKGKEQKEKEKENDSDSNSNSDNEEEMEMAKAPLTDNTDTTLSDEGKKGVRFHESCVLIPDAPLSGGALPLPLSALKSRRPRMMTKSVSLPLWKRRPSNAEKEKNDGEDGYESDASSVVVNIPIPRLLAGKSTSSPGRSPPPPQPLQSCLRRPSPPTSAHKLSDASISTSVPSSSSSSQQPIKRPTKRRPSLPTPYSSPLVSASSSPVPAHLAHFELVPLRACCADCIPLTEHALAQETWKPHFSRGAQRIRRQSIDALSPTLSTSSYGHGSINGHHMFVDEVDRRRSWLDGVQDRYGLDGVGGGGAPSPIGERDDEDEDEEDEDDAADREEKDKAARRKKWIEQQEDEDELFPLPSPRRTPTSSPISSRSPSPLPSPLGRSVSAPHMRNGSTSSVASTASSPNIPSAAGGRCEKGLLAPSPLASPPASAIASASASAPIAIALPQQKEKEKEALKLAPSLSRRSTSTSGNGKEKEKEKRRSVSGMVPPPGVRASTSWGGFFSSALKGVGAMNGPGM